MKMKKMFAILGALFTIFGATYVMADGIPVILSPAQQYAVMGSTVSFDISTSGAVTQDSKIELRLPSDLKFLSANIPPRNLFQVPLGEQPYWLIDSGSNFHVVVIAKELSQEFPELVVTSELVMGDNGIATGLVQPVADIQVEKVMTSEAPKTTGDTVSFDILVKNIGSKVAGNVKIVDIWPDNILTFATYGTLNGSQITPYIYNGIINQYEFNLGDINPGEELVLSVEGTMDTGFSVGTTFANTAFAILSGDQYSTGNDTSTVTGSVSGYPNLYVTAQKLSQDPSMNGDPMMFSVTYGNNGQEIANTGKIVIYLPEIMNQNTVSVSLEGGIHEGNMYTWELSGMNIGYEKTITITGEMMTNSPVGTDYTLSARIYAIGQDELTGADNNAIVTGKIQSLFLGGLSATIENSTRPTMNVTDTQIQAISGDTAHIFITIVNTGNVIQTGTLRVSYGNDEWYLNNNVVLIPGKSTVFNVDKVIGPKNYQTITPEIKFTYGDNQSLSTTVSINEPLQCGDGFITQNEACDTASTEGLLPGQHCSENCMSVITDNITNTACIQYTSEWGNGEVCDDAVINIGDQEYMCKSISSPSSVVQIDDDGKGTMRFTCETSNGLVADSIVIDCGNGQIGTKSNVSSFAYTCNYVYDDNGDNDYTASCIVNNEVPTNPKCEKDIMVGYGFYGDCGNGIIEPGEDCDLWNTSTQIWKPKTIGNYLDFYGTEHTPSYMVNNGYSCKNCKIIHDGDFVYEPAECMQTDSPISVMDNEIMPFWWRLWIKDTQRVVDEDTCYNYHNDKTLLLEDSMYCYFAVYNGKTYTQGNDSNPAFHFKTKCFNDNFEDREIFDYFTGTHQTTADGASVATVNTLLGGINHIEEYGEYKIVLEEVEYQYCTKDTHTWKKGQRYGAVCEVDFAVTKPYTMQISTLGVKPIATNELEFLHDFWDMNGNKLLRKTDLSSVISTDDESYTVTSNAEEKVNEFKEKYEKLAIEIDRNFKVNGRTIGDMFGNNVTVMKVPNEHIYFIKGNGTLTLSQDRISNITSAYTVFVDGMDVEIEGNVLQYAMIITTENMRFKDKGEDTNARCASGGQVVQGLFVALDGFTAGETLKNTSKEEQRCPWGGLHVKGVLIGDGLEDLMNSRRSQLNGWFTSNPNNVEQTRRNLIIGGAAVLIEYNPTLWKTLPPGAEIFTESLEVYRK